MLVSPLFSINLSQIYVVLGYRLGLLALGYSFAVIRLGGATLRHVWKLGRGLFAVNQSENLNNLNIPTDGNFAEDLQKGLSETSHVRKSSQELPQKISVFFDNLESHLVKEIEQHDHVFGCVAWLSNRRVLQALAKKKHVGIVIQQEDFLRPDSDDEYGNKIKTLYEALPPMAPFGGSEDIDGWYDRQRINFFSRVDANGSDNSGMNPIRIMGSPNSERKAAMPRMHHKFLCFGASGCTQAVWTGSFNITQNATRSRENAVVIEGGEVPNDYYQEFQRIWLASDEINPCDWLGKWNQSDFRFGT